MLMDEAKFNSIFSKNLRRYLEANDMTQVELAKKLNVGTTSVYNWCNGIKTPRMDKIDKMCQIFGCKRSDLITDPSSFIIPDAAQEFVDLFCSADPDVRRAVVLLLKSSQHDS